MVGRDIGTVVLPHATLKVFLTASAAVRAARRASEMGRQDRLRALPARDRGAGRRRLRAGGGPAAQGARRARDRHRRARAWTHRSTRSSAHLPARAAATAATAAASARTDGNVGLPSRRGGHQLAALGGGAGPRRGAGARPTHRPDAGGRQPLLEPGPADRRLGGGSPHRTHHSLHGQGGDAQLAGRRLAGPRFRGHLRAPRRGRSIGAATRAGHPGAGRGAGCLSRGDAQPRRQAGRGTCRGGAAGHADRRADRAGRGGGHRSTSSATAARPAALEGHDPDRPDLPAAGAEPTASIAPRCARGRRPSCGRSPPCCRRSSAGAGTRPGPQPADPVAEDAVAQVGDAV